MSRRPMPLWLIGVIAALPALPLAGAWQYAEASTPPPTTTTVPPDPGIPDPVLPTRVLSMRRQPDLIADNLSDRLTVARRESTVERFLADLASGAGSVDWCVEVVGGDTTLVSADSGVDYVTPASNEKLLIAAAALDAIGPDTRFLTRLVGPAPANGVIAGDVYLVGGGDPLLVTGLVVDPLRHPAFNTTPLGDLVDGLVAQGVTKIDGDVVGDGSRYDDEFRVPSWDDRVSQFDAAPYDALLIDDGQFAPGSFGLVPDISAAQSFINLLRDRGLEVTGSTRNEPAPAGLAELASIESGPLTEVVAELLQTSDNVTAEMLLKEIGYVVRGEGSRAGGIAVVRERLLDWGLDIDGVVIDDGSGLSRDNRVTCELLLGVLHVSPDDLRPLLPTAGRTGTLSDQFVGTPAEGRLVAKTGTLTGVKALTGSVDGEDGERFDFSIVLNGTGANEPLRYQPIWDDVVDLIDNWPGVVDVAVEPLEPLDPPIASEP